MKKRAAFSLVELLVVIAIIAILAGILIPTVGAVRQSARQAQAVSDLRQVGAAMHLYIGENRGRLPGPGELGVNHTFNRNQDAPSYLSPSLSPYLAKRDHASLTGGDTETVPQLVCPGFLRHDSLIARGRPHYIQNYTLTALPGQRVFGNHQRGILPPTLAEFSNLYSPSRAWILTNLDQALVTDNPGMASTQVSSSTWFTRAPAEPVWGGVRLRLYLDGHVAAVPRDADP